MRRQLVPASRLRPGDVADLGETMPEAVVERVTGSPGRPPRDGVRLVRVHVMGTDEVVAVREDAPISIAPRRTVRADAVTPGLQVRIDPSGGFRSVARVTGSPGAPAASGVRLVRIYLDGDATYRAVRADTAIEVSTND